MPSIFNHVPKLNLERIEVIRASWYSIFREWPIFCNKHELTFIAMECVETWMFCLYMAGRRNSLEVPDRTLSRTVAWNRQKPVKERVKMLPRP